MKIQKDSIYLAVIILLIALCGQFYYSYRYLPTHDVAVYYNQDQKLNDQIIDTIKEADQFVYFSVYTFTRQDIKDALLGAKYRGLKVVGLTDGTQLTQASGQKEIIKALKEAGIPVYEQHHDGIMHLKVLVTEKAYASGSYNWTTSATNINDEVLEVGHYEPVRARYQAILEELFKKYQDYPALQSLRLHWPRPKLV
ncbi:MAG: hypothetical protein KGJ93_00465 [Patescibacteria group bacterium]|nr:hypothetical protein [Patescibacteria group bacterium]